MQFKAKKSLGQNFLIDKNILKKIVDTGNISRNDKTCLVGRNGSGKSTLLKAQHIVLTFTGNTKKTLILLGFSAD